MRSESSKVLFVDDEESILKSLARLFVGEDGIDVIQTTSQDEALEIVDREEIAVIVSDNMMPGMSGAELLSKIKLKSPDTVRVMLTASHDQNTAIEAINRGEVYRFIVKPWDNERMISVVREGVSRYGIVKSLEKADEGALLSLAQTIELKDSYTKGHCDRVARYALLIADALGMDEAAKVEIKYGSWLHDCGKIGVPEAILNFPGPLNEDEMEVVKQHPVWGAQVVQHIKVSDVVRDIILHHHERVDGMGYPAGLAGSKIPMAARIVAVADVYDSLKSERAYRKALDKDKVKEIVLSMTGSTLDRDIVEKFLPIADKVYIE